MNNKRFFTCLLSFLLVFSTIPFQFENGIHAETIQEDKSIVFATYGEWPALSSDGKTVFVGKGRPDNRYDDIYDIGMYNTETGSLIKTITVDNGSDSPVFSPLGNYIALSGKEFILLDGKSGEKLYTLPYNLAQFSFKSTDDSLVALVSSPTDGFPRGNKLSIFDTKSNTVIYEKEYLSKKRMNVAMHPTLPIVAVSHGVDVEIINYETKQLISKIENPFNFPDSTEFWAIYQLSFSADGKLNMINRYRAETPFLQFESDENQNYKTSSLSIDAYINEPAKEMENCPLKISYGKNNEIILHYDHKIKFFNSTTGAYIQTLDGNIDDVVFSKNFDKIAYTKNVGYNSGVMPEYIEVQDYPIHTKNVNTIEFKDPAINLREGTSTYYSLEYLDNFGERTLLDPSDFKLESLDENIVTIDNTNKIIASKPGTTLVKATYNGLTDYLNVEVEKKTTSQINVETLYDSSTTIKGTAQADATLFATVGNREYRTTVNADGTFSIDLDKPLNANTFVWFMLNYGDDYLYEFVIRDTVAPKPPTITEIDETTSIVEGVTEPNATITISADLSSSVSSTSSSRSNLSAKGITFNTSSNTGKTTFTVKAAKNGKFKLSLKGMSGRGFFKATATDLVGNRSKATKAKIADTKAPTAPRVYSFSDSSTALIGVTEPNAKVHVRKNGKLIGNVLASKSGGFSVKVPKQTVGTVLTVTATDTSNNISKATTVKTLKAPKSPTVNKLTSTSKNVSGKAQPYTTIIVKNGSKVLGTNKANRNGVFSIKILQQKKGIKLSVISKNNLGAVSTPTVITVK